MITLFYPTLLDWEERLFRAEPRMPFLKGQAAKNRPAALIVEGKSNHGMLCRQTPNAAGGEKE